MLKKHVSTHLAGRLATMLLRMELSIVVNWRENCTQITTKKKVKIPLHKHFSVVDMWKHPLFLDFTMQVQLAKNTPKTWKMAEPIGLVDLSQVTPGSFRSFPNQLFHMAHMQLNNYYCTAIDQFVKYYYIYILKKLLNGHRTTELKIIMMKSDQVLLL